VVELGVVVEEGARGDSRLFRDVTDADARGPALEQDRAGRRRYLLPALFLILPSHRRIVFGVMTDSPLTMGDAAD
jgi:hypothetical protein